MILPPAIDTFFIALAGILGGGFGVAWLNRSKTEAEADHLRTDGHLETVDRVLAFNQDLLSRVAKLEGAIEENRRREDLLETRISNLEGEVVKLEQENRLLRIRCKEIESENEELKNQIADE